MKKISLILFIPFVLLLNGCQNPVGRAFLQGIGNTAPGAWNNYRMNQIESRSYK